MLPTGAVLKSKDVHRASSLTSSRKRGVSSQQDAGIACDRQVQGNGPRGRVARLWEPV
jgi:hypothetical protein